MQCTRCGFESPPHVKTACMQCGAPFTIGADPLLRAVLPVGRTPLSIIAGYAGLFSLLCAPAPLALGLGIWAVLDLKKRPGMHGMGRAVFAIVTGGIGTLAILAGLVAVLVARR